VSAMFVVTLVLAALTLISIARLFLAGAGGGQRLATLGTAALGALTLIFAFFSSATIVSTKTVGVVTSFGKPTGTLSNGFHLTAPWAQVHEFDAAIQTDDHIGDAKSKGDGDGPCITVRIANQATACVDNSIRWRIKADAADELYRDYKDFGNLRRSLVSRDLTATLNEVFSTYNPLAGITTTAGDAAEYTLDKLGRKATDTLRSKVGSQIDVLDVIIQLVRHDPSTQDAVNKYQAELANTRIAEQRGKTAANEKAANDILAGSVRDPNVLISKCLDIVAALAREGRSMPAGFQCFPGAGGGTIAQGK